MKKNHRRKYKRYPTRIILLISAFAVQLAVMVAFLVAFNHSYPYFYVVSFILSSVIVFIIVNQDMSPDVKLALVIPIMMLPVFGGFIYLLLSRRKPFKGLSDQETRMDSALVPLMEEKADVLKRIEALDATAAMQFRYLCSVNNYPVYDKTSVEYLSPGELFFERLKEKLRSARESIYMEYFILQEGTMWNEILGIMTQKAKAGVDVRLIYDDMGCVQLLPDKYDEQIRALGIRCRVYNHLGLLLSPTVNLRDHRKITVVDNRIAFTGGANLADEYINKNRRFRYWKDASIMLEGDAAKSFTCMFLSLWDALGADSRSNYKYGAKLAASYAVEFGRMRTEPYESGIYPHAHYPDTSSHGFVAPYANIPTSRDSVGKNVYLNLISGAREYIHICTPYFIPDSATLAMLSLASKNGIDIKIVTPFTPDKWIIHMITRSFYRQLIENGIEVYEYAPGFIHSKTVVCDHKTGVVGSINFDFRSLFFHHECAVLMYRTEAIEQMDRDFEEILGASRRISLEECLNRKVTVKLAGSFLRLFSPLF